MLNTGKILLKTLPSLAKLNALNRVASRTAMASVATAWSSTLTKHPALIHAHQNLATWITITTVVLVTPKMIMVVA
jgi:hypothetical protein